MAEDSIADDLLRNGYERWERLEGEKAAIGDDLKELFAELKGHGFTPKALRESFRRVRNIADADQQEHDTIVDLYVASLTGARPAPARVENIEEFAPEAAEVTAQKARLAALRANPAMSIVSAGDLKKSEPQPAPLAGSDLTTPPANDGQVADIQPETANEAYSTAAIPVDANAGGENVAGQDDAQDTTENTDNLSDADKSAEASVSSAPASLYAEPGVVTWESAPPEGVERHEYSMAFSTLGQDIAVIEDDLAGSKAEPIVKMGKVILDGWARYMAARSMVGLDGKPIEYSVVQYDGRDPMLDCIRWNLAGRILTEDQKRIVCQRMVKLWPQRKGPIYAAFEFGMELA